MQKKKKDGLPAYCRVSVSLCVRVCVCKCQTRQCDPRAWFLPTTTEWQLLKWLFFSCCGLSALEGRKQSLIRPECCHKVCMRPNACCFRTHTQCRYYLLKKLGGKSDLYFQFSQKQKSHGWNLWSNEALIPNTMVAFSPKKYIGSKRSYKCKHSYDHNIAFGLADYRLGYRSPLHNSQMAFPQCSCTNIGRFRSQIIRSLGHI